MAEPEKKEEEKKPAPKPQHGEKKEEKKEEPKKPARQETSIVRLAGRDISGTKNIPHALMEIKGIGHTLANAMALSISRTHGISTDTEIGTLSEEQMEKIEDVIKDPLRVKIPSYLMNRRKGAEAGADMHLVGTDLIVRVRQDIDNDIRNNTWRGFRHRYGQKVRGQRTRSTGRTGATVGVTKKAIVEAAKPAPAGRPGVPGAAAPAAGAAPAAAPAAGAAPKAEAPKPAAKTEEKK